MSHAPGPGAPVFILGIARRSGTNHLARLLRAHPACGEPATPLVEDHLLRHADLLVRYADAVQDRRPSRWGPGTDATADLVARLGTAVVDHVAAGAPAVRVVTKTPSVDLLRLAPVVLGTASVIVLVRDGRAVVESLVRGFRLSWEAAIDEWVRGACQVVAHRDGGALLVRYEDLTPDPTDELRRIFSTVDLDPDPYDFDAARSAPVVGSSFLRTEQGDLVWDAGHTGDVVRNPNPAWPRHARIRWDQRAADVSHSLGYPSAIDGSSTRVERVVASAAYPAVSRLWDAAMSARKNLRQRTHRP